METELAKRTNSAQSGSSSPQSWQSVLFELVKHNTELVMHSIVKYPSELVKHTMELAKQPSERTMQP